MNIHSLVQVAQALGWGVIYPAVYGTLPANKLAHVSRVTLVLPLVVPDDVDEPYLVLAASGRLEASLYKRISSTDRETIRLVPRTTAEFGEWLLAHTRGAMQ